ncbi:hypothetical protein [Streptomyces sp. NPDC048489]|uniref:hypothetical protein n=1 Tax=Streptomyces sp. NPDC048489 TaxID=3154504 RepID=UPI0034391C86
MTTTERLLHLAATAPAAEDEELVALLEEGNELYHQGLLEMHQVIAERYGSTAMDDLVSAAEGAGVPCEASQERREVLLLLAVAEWQMTPAALAYAGMAEDAAVRGVCLIPEG